MLQRNQWLVFLICYLAFGKAQKIIGAICDDGGFVLEAAFTVAVEAVSSEEDPYEAKVERTTPGDVLEAHNAMCTVLEDNVFGVFGPTNEISLKHIQSIADFLEVPQILVEQSVAQTRNWSAINLYPNHVAYSQVFADIIDNKGWAEFTIIYEGAELLPFFDSILALQDLETGKDVLMTVVQLPDGGDFRSHLQAIKKSGSLNYLINCRKETLPEFLLQAQQVGIMSDEHSYIIMNPDFQTIDLEPFKYGGSNITGIRLFDPSVEAIQNYIKSINSKVEELSEGQITEAVAENGLTLNLALIYDAVMVYVAGVKNMALEEGSSATCESGVGWAFGSTLLNNLKSMEIEGFTGLIKFDDDGFRSDFEIEILEVMPHGIETVATWTLEEGYEETRVVIPEAEAEGSESMKGKHFIVLTALSAPYGMLKESSLKLEGNDRYEGFGIELIEELAKMNEFNYTFDIQADGVYGSLDKKTGKWNGMMEKVMDGRADFAITDLTITAARQKAVDFTSPFMNLGITILYKKPTKQPPDLFSFISPFSLEVWGWLAGAYVGVSLLLFLLGRIAPEEWQNPYPCIEEPETLDNQFTMANSFWFTLGSVLTQGSEIAPIAVSTRMAGSMWWFFTLIMVSSYTANLAAFLTVESKFYAIKTVQDLASNPYGITYGAKKGGATLGFFKESDNLLYQKMYQYMDEHPEYQTSTNDEGLERAKSTEENYAFLMESTSIEYMVERNCDVAQVGGLLDSKGYGIAMKKNSPFRQPMSESILQLQEEGKLTRIKDKWWKEKRGGGACAAAFPPNLCEVAMQCTRKNFANRDDDWVKNMYGFNDEARRWPSHLNSLHEMRNIDDDAGSAEAQPLVLANVGGVFIVLAAGSGMAVICAILEMLVDIWVISHKEKVSFLDELKAEIEFIFKGSGDTKPVRHREPSGSGSGGSKKSKAEDEESHKENDEETNKLNVPTPSERSTSHHSRHTLHSRRQSNAVQMARMRKFSKTTY